MRIVNQLKLKQNKILWSDIYSGQNQKSHRLPLFIVVENKDFMLIESLVTLANVTNSIHSAENGPIIFHQF